MPYCWFPARSRVFAALHPEPRHAASRAPPLRPINPLHVSHVSTSGTDLSNPLEHSATTVTPLFARWSGDDSPRCEGGRPHGADMSRTVSHNTPPPHNANSMAYQHVNPSKRHGWSSCLHHRLVCQRRRFEPSCRQHVQGRPSARSPPPPPPAARSANGTAGLR